MKKILLIIILILSFDFLFAAPYSGSDKQGSASLTLRPWSSVMARTLPTAVPATIISPVFSVPF